MAAGVAVDTEEAVGEHAAFEIAPDLAFDEAGDGGAGFSSPGQERDELCADDLVEEGLLGLVASVVGDGRASAGTASAGRGERSRDCPVMGLRATRVRRSTLSTDRRLEPRLLRLGVKPPTPAVDVSLMPIHHRHQAAVAALLAGCLLAGCATKMTARELDGRLNRESQAIASRQAIRRVFPVYAQTRMEALILRTEAKAEPESSPLSRQLADGFRLGQRRRVDYVVGGPFPDLSDRLVLNGLLLNKGRPLPGLRIVLVSPAAPTPELRQAASTMRVRLEHRELN
jgi:hypothetical protein